MKPTVRIARPQYDGSTYYEDHPAEHIEGGLAVTPALKATGWKVTHVRTGYSVGPVVWPTRKKAKTVLRALLWCGDWEALKDAGQWGRRAKLRDMRERAGRMVECFLSERERHEWAVME